MIMVARALPTRSPTRTPAREPSAAPAPRRPLCLRSLPQSRTGGVRVADAVEPPVPVQTHREVVDPLIRRLRIRGRRPGLIGYYPRSELAAALALVDAASLVEVLTLPAASRNTSRQGR